MYQHTLSVETSEPALIPQIIRLLRTSFGEDVPPEFFDSAFFDWKFFRERPGWEGSRSFVIQQQGAVAGHACVWPSAFHTRLRNVSSCHLLDWAASPEAAGAGIAIYRELTQMRDTAVVIGGSRQALRLLPKLGFQPYGVMRYFARVIRPLQQFQLRPKSSACRELLRLARNTTWARLPRKRATPGWSASRVRLAGEWLDDLAANPDCTHSSPGVRSSSLVNYFLDCPATRCHLFAITFHDQPSGYFLLNEVHGQTRIIELFVRSSARAGWEAAYRLAIRAAAELPGTCEIVAASSLGWLDEVLRRCRMRERAVRPALLLDPRGLLAGAPPLHLQMTDSDTFFLCSPSFPFLT